MDGQTSEEAGLGVIKSQESTCATDATRRRAHDKFVVSWAEEQRRHNKAPDKSDSDATVYVY